MRNVILSSTNFKAPYFLPFLLTGYYYATKSPLFDPTSITVMKPSYNTTVPPLFDGNSPSDRISEAMGMSFNNPVILIAPSNVLSPTFIGQLNNVTSPEVAILRQNDSYRVSQNSTSTWKPTIPMRMYHHRNDDLVPYANSQAAFDAFSTAGAKNHIPRGPGVELLEELVFLTISSTDPVKTVHLGAAFPELSNGWNWLNGFKK
jgi:hypothetical protein